MESAMWVRSRLSQSLPLLPRDAADVLLVLMNIYWIKLGMNDSSFQAQVAGLSTLKRFQSSPETTKKENDLSEDVSSEIREKKEKRKF